MIGQLELIVSWLDGAETIESQFQSTIVNIKAVWHGYIFPKYYIQWYFIKLFFLAAAQ